MSTSIWPCMTGYGSVDIWRLFLHYPHYTKGSGDSTCISPSSTWPSVKVVAEGWPMAKIEIADSAQGKTDVASSLQGRIHLMSDDDKGLCFLIHMETG